MHQSAQKSGDFFYVPSDALSIVFADDDPVLREFAKVHLSSDTVNVETASDGLELIKMIEAALPDIILLDLEMPNMDGFAVLEHLAGDETLRRIPVIVVTGRDDVAAIDRAYEAGATSFVVKPMNWRQLSYQIRYVRRAARHEASLFQVQETAMAALKEVAAEGSKFLSKAVSHNPALKAAGARFASALYSAVAEPRNLDT